MLKSIHPIYREFPAELNIVVSKYVYIGINN